MAVHTSLNIPETLTFYPGTVKPEASALLPVLVADLRLCLKGKHQMPLTVLGWFQDMKCLLN